MVTDAELAGRGFTSIRCTHPAERITMSTRRRTDMGFLKGVTLTTGLTGLIAAQSSTGVREKPLNRSGRLRYLSGVWM
jgi:hypothetical protein